MLAEMLAIMVNYINHEMRSLQTIEASLADISLLA